MIAPGSASRVHAFAAYGVRVGLRTDDPAVCALVDDEVLRAWLPPGWRSADAVVDGADVLFDLSAIARQRGGRSFVLRGGSERVAESGDVAGILRAFVARAERVVAERAPAHLFVHAGVIGCHGRTALLPGRSGAGKTTLVRACLEAGATYYSDEFAVLDREGRVHPYARPLSIRGSHGGAPRLVAAAAYGASSGTEALPVGLVVVTTYRLDARWWPRQLTPGRALLALMDQTVAAQGSPALSMPILRQVVMRATTLEGARGEAAVVAADILARLGAPCQGGGVGRV